MEFLLVYFHSITAIGLIFQGNTTHDKQDFTIQKIIIKITEDVKKTASNRELFEKFNTPPLPTEYLFSSLSFFLNKVKKI
jgi:hypothetical protein